MMKAVLTHNDVTYERTHNIAYLLTLLDEAELPRPEHADDLPNLSPWAGEFRYARVPDAVPDRQEMRTLVEQTRAWAESQLPGEPPDPKRDEPSPSPS